VLRYQLFLMGVGGHGIDIQSLSKFHSLLQRCSVDRLARKILNVKERELMRSSFVATDMLNTFTKTNAEWTKLPINEQKLTSYLAMRWAIKESIYKASHPDRLDWHQVTVTKDNGNLNLLKESLK
jgi:phosphopantetheinyl transferase (holo-ACP synthase)